MKRCGNLYPLITDRDNICCALYNAAEGVKKNAEVQERLDDFDDTVDAVCDLLVRRRFHTAEYHAREIYEPKKRTIHILPFFPDRIVQHAIVDVLGPLVWEPMFIYDSYACRVGKGAHRGLKRAAKFVKANRYFHKYDIRGFYHNIRHDRLKRIIEKKIKCVPTLDVLFDIVDSFGGDTGCPIGNLTSQWFGNVYMNELDHYVKDQMGVGPYIRYCDDFATFGNDKGVLRWQDACIGAFVESELGLTFSKRVLARTADGLDFLGYRTFPEKILLRRSTAKRIRHRIEGIGRILERGEDLDERRLLSLLGAAASSKGVCKHAQTHNFTRSIRLEETYDNILMRYKAVRTAGDTRHTGRREGENAGSPESPDSSDADGAAHFATSGAGRIAFAVCDHTVLLRGRPGEASARRVYGVKKHHGAAGQSEHGLSMRRNDSHDGKILLLNLKHTYKEAA